MLGTLTETVRQISGDDCEITGASRTDSGAHARGQVCHWDTLWTIPAANIPRVLNNELPADLAVMKAEEVHPEFHSRFWADSRWYRYRIYRGLRDPLRDRYAHHFRKQLDVEAMALAAKHLVGEHDFRAFGQELEPNMNTVRRLFEVKVREVRDEVWIDIRGTAFIRGMMRRMSGGLQMVGSGRRDPEHIRDLLNIETRDALTPPPVLPARGLTLMRVFYGRHPYDRRRGATEQDFLTTRTVTNE